MSMAGAAPLVDRDEGQRLAREELARSIYAEHEPSLIERFWDLVGRWLERLTAEVVATVPGGWWTLVPLLLLVVALVLALLAYLGPSRRARGATVLHQTATPLTAAQHRQRATEHAHAGELAAAVRERVRAISREAEERVLIQVRPGRTATELASELATELPAHAGALHDGARVFNEVTYGKRSATPADYQQVTDLDEELRQARPDAASAAATSTSPRPGGTL